MSAHQQPSLGYTTVLLVFHSSSSNLSLKIAAKGIPSFLCPCQLRPWKRGEEEKYNIEENWKWFVPDRFFQQNRKKKLDETHGSQWSLDWHICWQSSKKGVQCYFKVAAHCLKITQNVAFEFWILAFFTNICPIKIDLSGNTVWPQASGFQKLAKMDHFWHF